MLRLTAERRSLAKVSGASESQPTIAEDIGVSHSSSKARDFNVAALRKRRAYLRDTLTILACAVALVAICLGKGWLETHTPQIIAGLVVFACISLLGVLVGAFIAGPKS